MASDATSGGGGDWWSAIWNVLAGPIGWISNAIGANTCTGQYYYYSDSLKTCIYCAPPGKIDPASGLCVQPTASSSSSSSSSNIYIWFLIGGVVLVIILIVLLAGRRK